MKTTKTFRHIHHILLLLLASLLFLSCDRNEPTPPAEETKAAPQYEGTIIAVGDSLTAGLGVAEAAAWPALLEDKLRQNGYNWQVINAGISGETSSGAFSRIKWITAQKPDIVILSTGANDGLRGIPVPVIKENISKAVQMLREENIIVVLAGMQIVRNLGPDYTSAFADIYPAVAQEQECILIPFLLRNVAGEPALNQADTIHPNEEGHKIIVETVYPFILKAVRN
ncbi:MAG: arylesterase [Desulfobulbaceae bacterium]|nr:arylesterase [Desulfobulbaceae bacterium]